METGGQSRRDHFWRWVRREPGDACWEWGASFFPDGYGQYKNPYGLPARASRAAWTLEHGPIEAGLYVLHRCDNERCVRPDHLYLGTQADNMRDRRVRRRAKVAAFAQPRGLSPRERTLMRSMRWRGSKLVELARMFNVTLRTVKLTCRGCGPRSRKVS